MRTCRVVGLFCAMIFAVSLGCKTDAPKEDTKKNTNAAVAAKSCYQRTQDECAQRPTGDLNDCVWTTTGTTPGCTNRATSDATVQTPLGTSGSCTGLASAACLAQPTLCRWDYTYNTCTLISTNGVTTTTGGDSCTQYDLTRCQSFASVCCWSGTLCVTRVGGTTTTNTNPLNVGSIVNVVGGLINGDPMSAIQNVVGGLINNNTNTTNQNFQCPGQLPLGGSTVGTSCTTRYDNASCVSMAGCRWDTSTSRCLQSNPTCTTVTTQQQCASTAGCTWDYTYNRCN